MTSKRSPAWCRKSPSAIWLRAEFWVRKNSTFCFLWVSLWVPAIDLLLLFPIRSRAVAG